VKQKERFKILGYIFIGVGFLGMVFIFGYVFYSLYQLFFVPSAPASFSIVLPGVHVPGSAIFIPLWVLIPLFFVVLIHESGHGLVARANGIKIKSTGLVFFGPLAGAFVEPDEKQLEKSPDHVKYSVFAAGPGINFLTAGIGILLLLLVLNPLVGLVTSPNGFVIGDVQDGYPAKSAGVHAGQLFSFVNGVPTETQEDLLSALTCISPGDKVVLSNENESVTIVSTESPNNPSKGYLGVLGVRTNFEVNPSVPKWLYLILNGISQFIFWFVLLSIGLGAFNLLPLGPVDGGQMIRLSLNRIHGKKKGNILWAKLGWFLLVLILILIFAPMLKALLLV
jgi:membrane-associated protease RseP (regulator of RpoE activity)